MQRSSATTHDVLAQRRSEPGEWNPVTEAV
jgi:hypothetical protein